MHLKEGKRAKLIAGLDGVSCEERPRTLGCPIWRRRGQELTSLLSAAPQDGEAEGGAVLCSWLFVGRSGTAES